MRYSATHRDEINTVYRLSPIDAYEQGLVKQIYVSSIISHDNFNQPYIRLISVDNTKGYKATMELDVQTKHGITRAKKTLICNSDLFIISGEREVYRDWYITNIDCQPGNEHIELNGAYTLYVGQAIGDISEHHMKRGQIRKTIEHHLDKELLLLPQGIKVLSLFFIDKVNNYRVHEGSTLSKGNMLSSLKKNI